MRAVGETVTQPAISHAGHAAERDRGHPLHFARIRRSVIPRASALQPLTRCCARGTDHATLLAMTAVLRAELEAAAQVAGLACRGAFVPGPEDGVPPAADGSAPATVVLLGFTGGAQWPVFAASAEAHDGAPHPLDRWSRRVVGELAARFAARAEFPDEGPPWRPFQRWARRAEAVHPSPTGVLIHPRWGLWHAYRGALAFREALDWPTPAAVPSACTTCAARPCESTCPVGAIRVDGYDASACAAHVASPAGRDCLNRGCLARRACPVGPEHRYGEAQAQFHMRAFLEARQRAG